MNTLLVLISVILASIALFRKPKREKSSLKPDKSNMNGEKKLGVIDEVDIANSTKQQPQKEPPKKPQKYQPARCRQRKSKSTALANQRRAVKS